MWLTFRLGPLLTLKFAQSLSSPVTEIGRLLQTLADELLQRTQLRTGPASELQSSLELLSMIYHL